MARPTEFTQKRKDEFCRMIAEGYSARAACRYFKMDMATLYRHVRDDETFRNQYARAKEDAADTYVDEMMRIADEEEDVNRAKLKIDARKWVASRMKPKSWGDKQQHEVTGEDGGPLSINIVRYGSDSTT